MSKQYLPRTPFSTADYYAVEINDAGLTVYSECCADTMSVEAAAATYEALGRYLADRAIEDRKVE